MRFYSASMLRAPCVMLRRSASFCVVRRALRACIRGNLCGLVGAHGNLWELYAWELMGTYGNLWEFMGTYGNFVHGNLWELMGYLRVSTLQGVFSLRFSLQGVFSLRFFDAGCFFIAFFLLQGVFFIAFFSLQGVFTLRFSRCKAI